MMPPTLWIFAFVFSPLCVVGGFGGAQAFELIAVEAAETGSTCDPGFYGQLLVTVKECLKWAFLSQPVRLMTAMYQCEMLVSSTSLGKVYAVLNKRQSKILSEEMKEGTDTFIVKALVPVTHSFGFVEDIRRKSSGLASPQLIFSHWGIIYGDPFWVPSTKEELEHYGDLVRLPPFLTPVLKVKGTDGGLPQDSGLITRHATPARHLTQHILSVSIFQIAAVRGSPASLCF